MNINVTKLLNILGTGLTIAAALVSAVSQDKKNEELVKKEVEKQLQNR